jgi:transcriptional regulator with XRE-family HTH domain
MTNGTGSTVPRRQLGRALREHRERAGISMKAAYEFLDCSYQRLWRLETGEPGVTIKSTELEALCAWYQVHPDKTKVLVSLAKVSKGHGWWQNHAGGNLKWAELFFSAEASSSRIRQFSSTLVPGLLQARGYMDALYLAERSRLPADVTLEATIESGQERQRILQRAIPPAPQLEFMLAETVLRTELKIPGAMQQQLWHLLKANELPNVSVRVLPISVGLHSASISAGFTILEFPALAGGRFAEPPTVFSDDLTGSVYLDQPDDLAIYERVWSTLAELALSMEDSAKMITAILADLV